MDAMLIKRIRLVLGENTAVFADRFGYAPVTIEKWEQGTRSPSPPARLMLNKMLEDFSIMCEHCSKELFTLYCDDCKTAITGVLQKRGEREIPS